MGATPRGHRVVDHTSCMTCHSNGRPDS
jgi:hypothetical protein